ncbi:SurA N-terminal domain-containing protein [Sphingomonas sp. CJ20]
MLKFFRNFTKSRYGLIAVFVFLGLIAVTFAVGDVMGVRSGATGPTGGVIAKVGDTQLTEAEVRDRIDRFIRNLQQQGQTVTMEQFLAQGGLDLAIDEMISGAALVEFAKKSGMEVSKKLIDGEIASNPSFLGFDGKFSQKTYEDLLAQNRISPIAFRQSLISERYANWLVNRATIGTQIPDGVVLPYASLLLERRTGIVGLVSTIAMDPGAAPDDKALTAYYTANRTRYLVPQRRVVRYAIVKPDALRAGAAATEAEIADAYKKNAAKYAATEKRTVRQLVLLDQATANRVAAEVKGGKTIAAAAAAAGLEPTAFTGVEKAELARQTAPAIADAAFAAAQGAVLGPIRSPLGWNVLQVEKVEKVAARTLDQVRTELADEVTQRKTAEALGTIRQSIEDGIGDDKTFDEVIRDAKLTAAVTPALTAAGLNPDDAAAQPDPALALVVRAGFAMESADDDPQVVPAGPDGSFALVKVDRIVAAAPRPLASIRDQVKQDYLVDKALQKARAAAAVVIAKLEKGVPMQQALTEAGVTKGPPPKPFDFKRAQILGQQIAPSIQRAFSMAPKKAKLVEAENRAGYYVVYLDTIEEHSAAGDRAAIDRVRNDITPQIGGEYARQFIQSLRSDIKVTRNEQAIAALRAQLTRQGTAAR